MILGCALIPFLPVLISDYESLAPLGIDATLIFLLYLFQSASSYFFLAYRSIAVKADQKLYLLNRASFAIDTVSGIVQIAVLVLTRNFVLYTLVLVAFTVITNLVYACIATRRYPSFFSKEQDGLSREDIVSLFKDCGTLFVFKVDSVMINAIDNIVLSATLGLTAVAVYSNYLLFRNAFKGIFSKIFASVKASIGNVFAIETVHMRHRLFETMNFVAVLLYGTAGVCIAVNADELIRLWIGEGYVAGGFLAVLVGIDLILSGLKLNLAQTRSASGVFRQMWYRPLIGIAVNAILSIVLVRYMGIGGVVVGTIAAACVANLSIDPVLIYRFSFNGEFNAWIYYKKTILYFLTLVVAAALGFWFSNGVTFGIPLLDLTLHILFCIICVPALLLILFGRSYEVRYLLEKAGTLWKRRAKLKKKGSK